MVHQLHAPRRTAASLATASLFVALSVVPAAGMGRAADAGNNAPTVAADTGTATAGAVARFDVLANDSDPDGDALTLEEAYLPVPDAGFARAVGGQVEYTAAADFAGAIQITYRVSDGRGGLANGVLDVQVAPAGGSPAPNNNPVAVDDEVGTTTGAALTVEVLGNDSDPDGDVISLTSVGQPKHGRADVAGNAVRYTPKAGFSGADSFKYRISDNRGGTATGVVRVNVAASVPAEPPTVDPPGSGTGNPVVTRRTVERSLDQLGLPTGRADGKYDAKTRRAMCTWRTVMGRKATRALPSAGEARAIVSQQKLPAALGSMITGLNISKTCQAAFWVSSANNYRAIMAATTGKPGYGTRAGVHRVFISWRVWRYSTIYEGARMYKPMQFSGGQAVHGSSRDSLVKTYPASHGCVRMLHKDIDRLQGGGFGLGSAVRVFGAW